MRILLVMILGFFLAACGQNYEEVYGIKIGAPISEVEGLGDYNFTENKYVTGMNIYEKNFERGDELLGKTKLEKHEINIMEIDGVVQGIEIISPYADFFNNEESNRKIEEFIDQTRVKYGDPVREEIHTDGRIIEFMPKDSFIYKIVISYWPSSIVSISFLTKKANDL